MRRAATRRRARAPHFLRGRETTAVSFRPERRGASRCRAGDTVVSSSVGRRDCTAGPREGVQKGPPRSRFLAPPGAKIWPKNGPGIRGQIPVPRTGKWSPGPFSGPKIPAHFFPKFWSPAANFGPAQEAARATGAPLPKRRPRTELQVWPPRPGACILKRSRRHERCMAMEEQKPLRPARVPQWDSNVHVRGVISCALCAVALGNHVPKKQPERMCLS